MPETHTQPPKIMGLVWWEQGHTQSALQAMRKKKPKLKTVATVCGKEISGLYKNLMMTPKFGTIKVQRSQNKKGGNQ